MPGGQKMGAGVGGGMGMGMGSIWTWMGTSMAVAGILRGLLPAEYKDMIESFLRKWFSILSPNAFFVIREFEGSAMNDLYLSVQSYLSKKTATVALVSNLFQPKNAKEITFSLANEQRVLDEFGGANLEWIHKVSEKKNQTVVSNGNENSDEKRQFQLKMKKGDKDRILDGYLAHVKRRAKEIERESRELMLHTNRGKRGKAWEAVPFLHPSTFESLALDPTLKARLMEDLDEFSAGEEFYKRVGKAWKRGYLLFGPPGTGKSSMIAAIANKMKFDIYDLELTEVESNAELRRVLLQTANKSIIVIEDIDCSLELSGQRKPKIKPSDDPNEVAIQQQMQERLAMDLNSRVTLSGLLNFTDGLWSSSGSERIFIFTTNHVDELDPALLRPGRMDMHIALGYCTFQPFTVLARNYLYIDDHPMYEQIEKEFEGVEISPAEIAEVLTAHRKTPDLALEAIVDALKARRAEGNKPHLTRDDLEDWKRTSLKRQGSYSMSLKQNSFTRRPPSENGGGRQRRGGGEGGERERGGGRGWGSRGDDY